jgi:hypothetical protein
MGYRLTARRTSISDDNPSQPKPPALTFTPVPVRPRWDGWSRQKQADFIEALAATACVEEACRAVGMSDRSAYALRSRPRARSFRGAWDAALDMGMQRLEQAAFGRALHGVARPVFFKGEQVGEWREYDERLAMFLLRYRRPERFGAWLDRALPPRVADDDCTDPLILDDPAVRLDGHLDGIEFEPGEEEDEDDPSPIDSPAPDFPRTVGE